MVTSRETLLRFFDKFKKSRSRAMEPLDFPAEDAAFEAMLDDTIEQHDRVTKIIREKQCPS